MPTAIRKKRDRLRALCRRLEKAHWDNILANPPLHLQARLAQKESQLSRSLLTEGPENGVGRCFDNEGQLLYREIPDGLGINIERHENRVSTAKDMRDRYRKIWGKRGFTKRIAHLEDKNIRTIQKYMKDFP